jgi:hypothetical protein
MKNKKKAAPRKPLELRDRHVYALLVVVSILIRIPFLRNFDLVTYDGTYYVNHANTILGALDRPSAFPIGYPAFIALFIPLIRDGVRAAQTVSFLAGLGSLLVFYSLAKRFVRRSHALLGALILALTPLFISLSMMTMSESIYLLWLLLGMFFYAKESDLPAGLFMGLAAITRPEALGILGVLVVLMLRRPRRLPWVAAGFACVYCINMTIQSITAGKLILVPKANLFGTNASNWWLRETWVDFPGKAEVIEKIARKSEHVTVLVDYLKRMPREIVLLIRHVSPGVLLLSLYGMFRKRLFLLAALVPFLAFPLFTFRSEDRFILPYVPVFVLYALIGIEALRGRLVYRCAYALFILSAAASLYVNRDQLIKSPPAGEIRAKVAGLRFRGIVKPWDKIADRKPFFSFYAGGRYVEIPVAMYDETIEDLVAKGVEFLYLDRGLIHGARPRLRPLLYDRAVIAGEMRFAQRSYDPGGVCIYQRTGESEPAKKRFLVPPLAGAITGLDWSPDGRTIAYSTINAFGGGGIFLISPDADGPRLLVADPGTEGQVSWGPDSKRIAFAMKRYGNVDIYVSSESGTPERITSHPGIDRSPSWSRDGREIIFCSERSGRSEIWSKNLATGALKQITTDGGNKCPAVSPDGKRIAWIRDGEGVVVYARETGEVTRFESPRKVSFMPAWSPDGGCMAVTASDWGKTDIYLVTADGRNELLLTKSSPVTMGEPAWSPDGRALAAAIHQEDKRMGIIILTDIQPYLGRLVNPGPIHVFQAKP